MGRFTIEDSAKLSAVLEIQIDVLANQAALAEIVLKQIAAGDHEKFELLLADYNQKIQAQWRNAFERVSTQYASLPEEIWEVLRAKRDADTDDD